MSTNAMSKKAKLALFIIGLSASLYGASAFAGCRCGGTLISVGDSQYAVEQACGQPVNVHVVANGTLGSESYAYYKLTGETIEMHFIDGHVKSIGGNGNRN